MRPLASVHEKPRHPYGAGNFAKTKSASPSHEKKELILKAALHLAGTQDFTQLNLKEISQKSGISKSLILYYYPNLKGLWLDLFKALAQTAQAQTTTELLQEGDPIKRIYKIVTTTVQWVKKEPLQGRFFFLMYHQSSVDSDFRTIHQQVLARGLERIELCLFQSGKIKSPDHVRRIAFNIHNLIIGTMVRVVSLDQTEQLREHEEILLDGIKCLLMRGQAV